MILGTVTSKGQTTIPKSVRDELGLVEGSRIAWEVKDGKASFVPRGSRRAIEFAGLLGRSPGSVPGPSELDDAIGKTLAEDDDRIAREWHGSRE